MEMTKVVKPFIKKGVTQYFWQYSVISEQDIFSWDSSNMHFSLGLA